MHSSYRGDQEEVVRLKFGPFLEYLDLTKGINRNEGEVKDQLVLQRAPHIPKVELLIKSHLDEFFHKHCGFYVQTEVNIQKPQVFLSRMKKDSLNDISSEVVNDMHNLNTLIKNYEDQGYDVTVREVAGSSQIPIHLSDRTESANYLIATAGHEAFHLYHQQTNAANWRMNTREARNIIETSAELVGEQFVDYIVQDLPLPELCTHIQRDKQREASYLEKLQMDYIAIQPFLELNEIEMVQQQLNRIKRATGRDYTPLEIISKGRYGGCIDTSCGLEKISKLSASPRMFGDISGLLTNRVEVIRTQGELERMKDFEFGLLMKLTRSNISNTIRKRADPTRWYSDQCRKGFLRLATIFNAILLKYDSLETPYKNVFESHIEQFRNYVPLNKEELHYGGPLKPSHTALALIHSVQHTIRQNQE